VARQESVPTLVVQLTEMPETAGEIDAFFERFDRRSRLDETMRQELGRAPSENELVARLRAEGWMIEHAMLRHDNLMRGRITRAAGADFSPLQRFPCRQIFDGPYILWDGRIVACREDVEAEHVFGCLDDGLMSAWRSERVRNLLRLQRRGHWDESDLCRPCKEWFYGFR
jgi:radical SAM protein with 4Fe4S-binding SPASM domain